MAWHGEVEDPYYTSEAHARAVYYQILGHPTTVFDGTQQIYGGSSNTYNQYMTAYNSRHGVPSPLTVTYLARSYDNTHASVKVKVKLEQNIPSGNTVHLILWEDDIVFNGRTYRFTERLQAPPVTLTITQAGQEQTIKKEFTFGGSWDKNKLGVSCFVQKNADKSVLNGRAAALVSGVDVAPASLGRVKALFH